MTAPETELIGGKNPVAEALRSGRELNKIWIAEGLNKKALGKSLHWRKRQGSSSKRFRNRSWMPC